jgi:hypothetical protein
MFHTVQVGRGPPGLERPPLSDLVSYRGGQHGLQPRGGRVHQGVARSRAPSGLRDSLAGMRLGRPRVNRAGGRESVLESVESMPYRS